VNFNLSVLRLGSGTFFAQMISLLALPLLTKQYSPSEFGYFSLLILVTTLVLPISTLKIETLIVTSKNNRETTELVVLAFVFPIFISSLSFPIVFLIEYFSVNSLNNPLVTSIYFSTVLLTLSYITVLTQLALKSGAYKNIAISGFLQNLSTYSFQLLLGLYKPISRYLILSFAVGRIIGILPLLRVFKNRSFRIKVDLNHNFHSAIKYSKSNKTLIIASVLEALIYLIPSIVALYAFGLKYSGFIGLIQIVLLASTTLIGGSFSSVLFSEVAKITLTESFDKVLAVNTVKKIFKSLCYFSLFYGIVLIILGEKIFLVIFDKEWAEPASLLTWLALPFAISIIWKSIITLLLLTKNWQCYLNLTLTNCAVSLIFGYSALILNGDWKFVTFSFFAGQSFSQMLGSIYVYRDYLKIHTK